jgi:hypothetical protein
MWWVIVPILLLLVVAAWLDSSRARAQRRQIKAHRETLPAAQARDVVVPSLWSVWRRPPIDTAHYTARGDIAHAGHVGDVYEDTGGGGEDGGSGGGA